MNGERRTIFLFSMEPWGDMWYSKHHYANRLAQDHAVYFVGLPDRWRIKDLFSFGVKVKETKEGVRVVEYRNNLPLRFLPNRLARIVSWLNGLKLKRLYPKEPVILWTYFPARLLAVDTLRRKGDKLVYHVVDPFQVLPSDTDVARKADLVVAINSWFLSYYRNINANCVLVPHGVRPSDRVTDAAEVLACQKRWGTYVVVAASLNHLTNYGLIAGVAERLPQLRVVLIGELMSVPPDVGAIRQRLLGLPNVVHLGSMPPEDMRNIIGGAKAGLVTYDFMRTLSRPESGTRTPLKVLTYLAQACPVITTVNSYIPELDGKAVFKAEDDAHFVDLVGRAVSGQLGYDRSTVDQYLDSVDYGRLITRILSALDHPKQIPAQASHVPGQEALPWNCPILVISNEHWDGPRYSKHRYSLALAKYRKVFFLDPPDAWRPRNLFRWRVKERTTAEGITVLTYWNVIPSFNGRLGPLNDRIIARRVRRYLMQRGWGPVLFWSFDPNRLTDPSPFKPHLSVYHCVDHHGVNFPGEVRLQTRVDLIFCIARGLMPRFQKVHPAVFHVPHGIADPDSRPFDPKPLSLKIEPGYGLYIGNINNRHDFALWKKLITAHPDVQWVFVGAATPTVPLGKELLSGKTLKNVKYLGPLSYERIGNLVAHAGFGFLYLLPDQPANRISSQKVVQFLAQGKPFFTSWLSEYEEHRDVVHMSDGHEEALARFAAWRREGESATAAARRLDYARSLQFQELFKRLPFRVQQEWHAVDEVAKDA
ncbi:MAG TPA: hypothetical protein PLR96_07605 [Flavobacteriales bacterium]|nr:hypothetical protein [Flavobacteriales bacterium]